jgi:SAM-dependent methyltransferase
MPKDTAYDRLPYDSYPFRQTHPNHLCALARLHDVSAPDPRASNVLEIGCASGGNLIPMAEQLPGANFTGLDLSARQIGMAKRAARDSALDNVAFIHADICEFEGPHDGYDYVIAHGVYSWMPEKARTALLSFCAKKLAPNGVAYISYNTYPGWHLRGTVRDMMLYHAQSFESEADQVKQARALLSFLQEQTAASVANNAYRALLEQEARVLAGASDNYIRHEHLSGDNVPLYFHQFASLAEKAGLRFMAEAELANQATHMLSEDARAAIAALSDQVVRREQYLDFLRNRTFRQSVLVRGDRPSLSAPHIPHLDALALSAELAASDTEGGGQTAFKATNGTTLSTEDPLLISALSLLARRSPDRINTAALLDGLAPTEKARADLRNQLAQCVTSGLIAVHSVDAPYAVVRTTRPKASRVARAQAVSQKRVTNMDHRMIELETLGQRTLLLMDGSRTEAELLDDLIDAVVSGAIRIAKDARPVVEPEEIRPLLAEQLEQTLQFMTRSALIFPE